MEASGIDDILAQTDSKSKQVDQHPEKRMRAAWEFFVEERMPKMRKENPGLKRSQIIQILSKEWKTHEENPIVKAKENGTWRANYQKPGKDEE